MNVGKAIVSILDGYHVYPSLAPQGSNVYPDYSVYHIVSTTPEYTKDGATEIITYRVQIDHYSLTYTGCITLANAVRGLLDFYQGSEEGVNVDLIRIENEQDGWELDTREFKIIQDYFIRVII